MGNKVILTSSASFFVTVSFMIHPSLRQAGFEQRAVGGRAGSPGEPKSPAQAQPSAAPQPPVPSPAAAAEGMSAAPSSQLDPPNPLLKLLPKPTLRTTRYLKRFALRKVVFPHEEVGLL